MRFLAPLAALAFAAASLGAQAAGYPSKNVTVVVPFPAGGSSDMVGRVVAQKLGEKLGGTFIVENKAGATGAIGAASVKNSPADGHTLLVSSLAVFVVNPHLQKSLPYDPSKDFDLLTVAVQAPNVLVVPASAPQKSVAEVLATLKAEPGRMSFASSGNGSSDHLTAELFWQQTGTSGLHVPYKGGGPAMQDLLGGQVNASFQNINAVIPHVKTGKLRALAITSTARSPQLPDVPTLAEAGVQGADIQTWYALYVTAGTPRPVVERLAAELQAALKHPDVVARIKGLGGAIQPMSIEAFAEMNRAEFDRYGKLIRDAGIKVEGS